MMPLSIRLRSAAKSAVANMLPKELFDSTLDRAGVSRLFAQYVRLVEIENHSYCNRTCWFCPNATIDRRSAVVRMTDALFRKILDDLASIVYRQTLIWSRYHEPLADASIFDRIAQARAALPSAYLTIVSNGDYLNREAVARLQQSGLNRMMLDLYLPEGKERDAAEIDKRLREFESRTGLQIRPVGQSHEYILEGSSIAATMGVPLYTPPLLSTRGGLIDVPELRDYRRTALCFNPLHSVVVDYNGKAVLCCQVRSDAPQHADAVIGDLNAPEYGLFEVYRDMAGSRAGLLTSGPKSGVCQTCTVSASGSDPLGRRSSLAAGFSAIPGTRQGFESVVRWRAKRPAYGKG